MDRNQGAAQVLDAVESSLSARRAWIEMSPLMWPWSPLKSLSARRAWIEISASGRHGTVSESLSARRAWIEILLNTQYRNLAKVALRKESVDRNRQLLPESLLPYLSLSARRAWIEIKLDTWVALAETCRSPQGERG